MVVELHAGLARAGVGAVIDDAAGPSWNVKDVALHSHVQRAGQAGHGDQCTTAAWHGKLQAWLHGCPVGATNPLKALQAEQLTHVGTGCCRPAAAACQSHTSRQEA